MTSLLVRLECHRCGEEFNFNPRTYDILGLKNIPKKCPRCIDKGQQRTIEVLDRKCLKLWEGVYINSLPVPFEKFIGNKKDRPVFRATIKGSLGDGVSWDGRLDVYSYVTDPVGKYCDLRLMEVTRNRRVAEIKKDPKTGEEKTGVRVIEGEKQVYLVVEPTKKQSDIKLIWLKADYKTTIKGLGRQYHASVDTETAVWSYKFSSSCRSSRYGSRMAIAIVAPSSPAYEKVWGDVEREEKFE